VRRPLPTGAPIDDIRREGWLQSFAGYHRPIDINTINKWLSQFDNQDQDLAARALDAISFYSAAHIATNLLSGLDLVPGWNPDRGHRVGNWRFLAYSISAGESGDSMLHTLRRACGLTRQADNDLFAYKSDLLRLQPTFQDTVIFVDDFAGTGRQACTYWEETMAELLPGSPNTYLLLVAATERAIQRIETDTPLRVITYDHLNSTDDIFSPDCLHFSDIDKQKLLMYNSRADPRIPRGSGDCGTLVVFTHGAPNDSIPILHANRRGWQGLFPRH
jgi:hypothetical protein